jgi:hypothetical protein
MPHWEEIVSSAQQRAIWGAGWQNYYGAFWTKAEIVNRIRIMSGEGLPIHMAAMAERGEWVLLRAAAHCHGSWRAAVKASGFSYDQVRADVKWTRRRVIQSIRKLRKDGEPLNSRAVQLGHPPLFAAACRSRLFGSWREAVKAAGLSYTRITLYEKWDSVRVAETIAHMHKNSEPMNASRVLKQQPLLYYAACHQYGSWGRALKALGINPQTVALRKRRTKAEIVREIRKLKKERMHLSDSNVRRHIPDLHAAACRTFGTWVLARSAALGNGQRRGGESQRLFAWSG